MIETGVIELLYGLGRFFLNPAFYIILLFSLILGIRRTKRERKDFNIRIRPFNLEWTECMLSGLGVGLIISLVMLGLGVVIAPGFMMVTSLITILFLLTLQPRWLSPAYVIGLAIILSIFLPKMSVDNAYVSSLITEMMSSPLLFMAILLSLLLFAESFLILKKGYIQTSPKLKKSKRGKRIGTHEAKKLWVVPVLMFIPGDTITSMFAWWPVLETPFATFSLLAVPFAIGFQQQVQSTLPKEAIQRTGKNVLILAFMVSAFTTGAYWLPVLALAAAVIAIVGREFITVKQRLGEDGSASFFANNDVGIVILGVIPNSPAEKMALQVGEIISKVNGNPVRTEKEFYEALQANRALCKLDILDFNGEVRFVTRALYEGEHHELGLLFVHDENEWSNEAV